MRLIFLFSATLFASWAQALPNDFAATASQSRRDGIMVTFTPDYPYRGEIHYTMTKSQCYAVGTPTPFEANDGVVKLMDVNDNWGGFGSETPAIFDNLAPDGVQLCYMLVGRGQVEAVAWGYRMTPANQNSEVSPVTGFRVSKDRMDGIRVEKYPPLTDFSVLYATPDASNCPRVGDKFEEAGRFVKVGLNFFNGSYYVDEKAAIAIDLCYFLISKRTGLVTDYGWGYRLP